VVKRRTPFDDKRARIAEIAASAPRATPQQTAQELRAYVADPNGYLAGEAAEVAGKLGLHTLIDDLVAAFSRLLKNPVASDKACLGKKRILEALLQLEADVPDTYLAGLHHVQREPSFPEPIDTAAPLRSLCAHALIQFHHPNALIEVTPLLMDTEPDVRAEAATALGNSRSDVAGAILHLKVLAGDKEPEVLGACFKGLLRLSPQRYLPIVAARLQDEHDAVAETAAIALGESRLRHVLPILQDALASAGASRLGESILLGIALLRTDEATDYLLSLLAEGPERQAAAALSALALHRHDPKIEGAVRVAVAARKSRKLNEVLADRFGSAGQ
jgi:HEAT repeat protein